MKLPLSKRKTKNGPADLLERAADLIEEHGWTRREFQSNTGCLCVMGAIGLAWDGVPSASLVLGTLSSTKYQAVRALAAEIAPLRYDFPANTVTSWNDGSAKSKRQVASYMRRAAKKLRATTGELCR